MISKGAPGALSEALIRATQHRGGERPVTLGLSIALSREMGGKGTSVARELGRRLGWAVYDQELLEQVAKELGVTPSFLECMDEKHLNWLQECIHAVASLKTVDENRYVRRLIDTILSLGVQGHGIFVGRGSPFILPAATTLRVRLVAPLEERIAWVAREFHLAHADAARRVREIDEQRGRFIQDHFQMDPAEPALFDVVLNTGRFSVSECADLIVAALKVREAHTTNA